MTSPWGWRHTGQSHRTLLDTHCKKPHQLAGQEWGRSCSLCECTIFICWWLTQVFTQNFWPRLIDHLYLHIQGQPYDRDKLSFSSHEHDNIIFNQNQIYKHKTIRFRSTTYDVCRMEESTKPHTHADIMVLSHEDDAKAFPYWHTRIIRIYHFMVCERTEGEAGLSPPSWMDVLLVWWLRFDLPDGQSGWRAWQLHKLYFCQIPMNMGLHLVF